MEGNKARREYRDHPEPPTHASNSNSNDTSWPQANRRKSFQNGPQTPLKIRHTTPHNTTHRATQHTTQHNTPHPPPRMSPGGPKQPVVRPTTPEDPPRIKLAVSEADMVRLESALELHRFQQKQEGAEDSDNISFFEFRGIASRIEAAGVRVVDGDGEGPERNKTAAAPSTPEPSGRLSGITREEHLWHDLYCLGVPVLYEAACGKTRGPAGESPPSTGRERRRRAVALLSLEAVTEGPGAAHRIRELRRLAREAATLGVPEPLSDRALELLREAAAKLELLREAAKQEKPRKAKANADASGSKRPSVDWLLGRGAGALLPSAPSKAPTTIDERVRARAEERGRDLEAARAASRDPREERVAMADALYSHARHLLRRRRTLGTETGARSFRSNRLPKGAGRGVATGGGGETPADPTRCFLAFGDLSKDGLAGYRSKGEVEALLTGIRAVLAASAPLAPHVLVGWRDPRTGVANKAPIGPKALVWIETAAFKQVRRVLGRAKLPEPEGAPWKTDGPEPGATPNARKRAPVLDAEDKSKKPRPG
ncbi:unnamed protein product [Pseudo-nitzschia multistriata]|uniref:Uncharacterized protein n=1 Tax=Pseudo-nitzschia multistriata TaxID=183589 RepID=A0A448ZMJ8_9STRA|nr:unnamed protein product [Pseudo-nitzschia multistriata]